MQNPFIRTPRSINVAGLQSAGIPFVPAGWMKGDAAGGVLGVTTEVTIRTLTPQIVNLGVQGGLIITTLWNQVGAGTRTARVRINGTELYAVGLTSTNMLTHQYIWQNRNSLSSQAGASSSGSNSFALSAAANFATTAIDTSAALTITLTGQSTTAGDSITLERVMVQAISMS